MLNDLYPAAYLVALPITFGVLLLHAAFNERSTLDIETAGALFILAAVLSFIWPVTLPAAVIYAVVAWSARRRKR